MNDEVIKDKIENMKKNTKRKDDWNPNYADIEAITPLSTTRDTINEMNGTAIPKPKQLLVNKTKSKIKDKYNRGMTCIGTGVYSGRIDSAGNTFDNEYMIRNRYRRQLIEALRTGNIPLGARNPIPIAQRIEAKIYKAFKDDIKAYRRQCVECAANISDRENREIRLNLLMGRLEPENFVFMSDTDLSLEKMIALRVKYKTRIVGKRNQTLIKR